MAYSNGPQIVTNGLVLSLDAADQNSYVGSGTVWNDLSGNNLTGSLTNGPTFSSANGGSIVFDGVNDYVNYGSPSIFNTLTSSLTLSCWFNIRSIPSSNVNHYYGLIAKDFVSTVTPFQLDFQRDSSTGNVPQILFGCYTSGISYGVGYTYGNNIIANTWYHVIGTFNGTTWNMYLNGSLVATNNQSVTLPTNTGSLSIGNFQIGLNTPFSGSISVAQIYNRALSSSEIQQNYIVQKGRFGL